MIKIGLLVLVLPLLCFCAQAQESIRIHDLRFSFSYCDPLPSDSVNILGRSAKVETYSIVTDAIFHQVCFGSLALAEKNRFRQIKLRVIPDSSEQYLEVILSKIDRYWKEKASYGKRFNWAEDEPFSFVYMGFVQVKDEFIPCIASDFLREKPFVMFWYKQRVYHIIPIKPRERSSLNQVLDTHLYFIAGEQHHAFGKWVGTIQQSRALIDEWMGREE